MNPEVLAVIPARGGSKRLPKKNIALVGGKPLLWYTVAAALQAKFVDRVIVSTESLEIAAIAKECGAEVPVLRPTHLAQDDSCVTEAFIHMLRYLREQEGYCPDLVVPLAPTSPLRIADDIDAMIQMAQETSADAIISVCETEHRSSGFVLSLGPSGQVTELTWHRVLSEGKAPPPPIYHPGGSIQIMRPEALEKAHNVLLIPGLLGYVIPLERALDVDLPWHLYLANLILEDIRRKKGKE